MVRMPATTQASGQTCDSRSFFVTRRPACRTSRTRTSKAFGEWWITVVPCVTATSKVNLPKWNLSGLPMAISANISKIRYGLADRLVP